MCGAGLLVLWFALKQLTRQSDAGGPDQPEGSGSETADSVSRSDVFWAGPSDILFWVAMVLLAIAVFVRVWRLVRRIRS